MEKQSSNFVKKRSISHPEIFRQGCPGKDGHDDKPGCSGKFGRDGKPGVSLPPEMQLEMMSRVYESFARHEQKIKRWQWIENCIYIIGWLFMISNLGITAYEYRSVWPLFGYLLIFESIYHRITDGYFDTS